MFLNKRAAPWKGQIIAHPGQVKLGEKTVSLMSIPPHDPLAEAWEGGSSRASRLSVL